MDRKPSPEHLIRLVLLHRAKEAPFKGGQILALASKKLRAGAWQFRIRFDSFDYRLAGKTPLTPEKSNPL